MFKPFRLAKTPGSGQSKVKVIDLSGWLVKFLAPVNPGQSNPN